MGARAAAPTHSSARRPPPPGCLRSEWGRRKAGRGWGKAGPGRARRSALPARSQRGTGTARPRSGDGAGRGGGTAARERPAPLPAGSPGLPGARLQPAGERSPRSRRVLPSGGLAWAVRALGCYRGKKKPKK